MPCLEDIPSCDGAIVYLDTDEDGYDETVEITCPTTLTDICELKVYFPGHGGDQEWEIRPERCKKIVGGNAVFTFWAWQLIDPELWEKLPPVDQTKLGLDLNDNIYMTQVDVYREYNNETATASQFYWEPNAPRLPFDICPSCAGAGCASCSLTTQDGCLHVRNADAGIIVPSPATYNAVTGAWDGNVFSIMRRADFVKVWYYAGEIGQQHHRGNTCDLLSNYWAQTIAWLATARLARPLCGCAASSDYVKELQQNSAFSSEAGKITMSDEDLNNPFGTRIGEIRAWKRIAKFAERRLVGVSL
jgi:hypothetical protein